MKYAFNKRDNICFRVAKTCETFEERSDDKFCMKMVSAHDECQPGEGVVGQINSEGLKSCFRKVAA